VTRDKALEAMDLLASQGYPTQIYAIPTPPQRINFHDDNGISYRVSVSALHFDKVDLKHLCAQGDALGLDVMVGGLTNGTIDFVLEDKTPAVVRNPRNHPR